MKRALWRNILVLWLAVALASAARATPGWSGNANMLPGSGVSIEYVSPFSQIPPTGYLPVFITINNRSGSARTYSFRLGMDIGRRMSAVQTVTAEADAETHALALLPLSPSDRGSGHYYRPANIQVTGDGVDSPQTGIADMYRSSAPRTVYVGMAEHMHTLSWGLLEAEISRHSRALSGSRVDLKLLPPDWRALSGLRCLWLTPQDYTALDAGQKTAVQDWISLGGVLYLCEQTPDAATRTEFGLPDAGSRGVKRGLGEVRWFTCDPAKALPADLVFSQLLSLDRMEIGLAQEAEDWGLAWAVGKLQLNVPFLFSFIALFAILIGPVNLFYLARSDRRHRLFWTTPAISLGASLLLIVVIILEDGFGGDGARVSLTYLFPAQNKAATVQEQFSRTGVLLSRDFSTGEGILLSPALMRNSVSQSFQQNGDRYGGDWFASRSLQAQRLTTIQPTRARIQLLNAEQAGTGAAPVLVSSLPVELEQLYFVDANGKIWGGKNLRTGEKQSLQTETELTGLKKLLKGSNYFEAIRGVALEHIALRNPAQSGPFFCAVAAQGSFIDTLRSIRWTREQALYVGPVTN